jgi:hypothetical protein
MNVPTGSINGGTLQSFRNEHALSRSQHDTFFQIRHDTLFSPAALLSLHHNIFDFITMPIVRCTTIFMIAHQASVLKWANTQLSGAAISSTVFEIYAALAASAGAGVRKDSLHYHDFFLELKHSFSFFTNLLFALSRFVVFINFYFLPRYLLQIDSE